MIDDVQALLAHFEKQGFQLNEEEGVNDIHSQEAVDFFERYFKSDKETTQIVKDGYAVPLTEDVSGFRVRRT